MTDLKQQLEKAKRWLLSAVPTTGGRAETNPLYVILRGIIDELGDLREKVNSSYTVTVKENDTVSVSASKQDSRIQDLNTRLTNLEEAVRNLQQIVEADGQEMRKSFAELVKMLTKT